MSKRPLVAGLGSQRQGARPKAPPIDGAPFNGDVSEVPGKTCLHHLFAAGLAAGRRSSRAKTSRHDSKGFQKSIIGKVRKGPALSVGEVTPFRLFVQSGKRPKSSKHGDGGEVSAV